LNNNPATWLPSIFHQHCAVGATFPTRRLIQRVFVPVKTKKPASGFCLFSPGRGHMIYSVLSVPCRLCAPAPSHPATICSLAQPSAPYAGRTQSADTLTPHTQGEDWCVCVCVCVQSHMWHHNQYTNVRLGRGSKSVRLHDGIIRILL